MTLKVDGTNGVLQAYDYQVLTTGFSYTFAAGTQTLIANPAGTLATGTITMPASPVDGMVITFISTQQITALTINGNTGQTVVSKPNALNANQALSYVYRLSNTTWYPMGTQAAQATGPAFSVYSTASQSVSNGVFTKIQLNTEEFDTANCFDSVTNYRFTPTVAGYYSLNGQVEIVAAGAGEAVLAIYKNGSEFKRGTDINATVYGLTVNSLVYLNGSTDYVELYVYVPVTKNLYSGNNYNYFQGFLARAA